MPDRSLIEIDRCEVCGTAAPRAVLDLGAHPMCDDLVRIGEDRICREYPIHILFCDTCRTAHQRFQVPKHELFPATYHYRSRQTLDVLNGMRRLVESCAARYGDLEGKKVLDIGCNDGSLLSIFREHGAVTFGIEPTGAAADAAAAGHRVVNAFFAEDVADDFAGRFGQPDIVTFTNVFAHIEDLAAVIRALKIVSKPETRIVIENHYLGAIIDKRQFDTFYHEHPRTYSATSFTFIAAALGMSVADVEFPDRYGGNIRVFLARAPQAGEPALFEKESVYGDGLAKMPGEIARWRDRKRQQIERAVAKCGPLMAKAFPGRAAIPIKMLGLGRDGIDAVYEKPGSGKIGHFVPGTRIPVFSDDDFPAEKRVAPLVNMAWHIAGEIETYLRGRGFTGEIIDIIAPADFAP
ncbi:class I SAM-dependent methyltransferase [Bradyrhizobium sp. NP1]|uniref:class I SAM-dependent methyltransferase n=1 Tax=Bradyrhizobium sp. NP1 TaxID=3049772 RepID=UPI0025A51B16|nr:class I SAM-dependent methyltransferase [Bradyrhizobium sp. NP1]WJR80449.1 class I SAM-dependent methyltransferase [Bradyrhizobium sp. NP1]